MVRALLDLHTDAKATGTESRKSDWGVREASRAEFRKTSRSKQDSCGGRGNKATLVDRAVCAEPRASDDVSHIYLLGKVIFMAKKRRWPDLKAGTSIVSLVCSRHKNEKWTSTWSWP